MRLCEGNQINYSDVTAWFLEIVEKYDITPAWVYYDPYSAAYFVQEMQSHGFNMVKCYQGVKTLSLPYLGYNLPEGIVIESSRESSFKKGVVDYRAMAIADCKPIVTEAFVRLHKKQS